MYMRVKYHGQEIELDTTLEPGEEELDLLTTDDFEDTMEFTPTQILNEEEKENDE